MRKDVKLGFGVGGILLAVIIVAVLVVHRNHNKAVTFDTTGKAAAPTDSSGGIDVNGSAADAGKTPDASLPAPATTKQPDAKGKPDGVKDQWDALFASSTLPVKSEIGNRGRQQPPVDPPANDSPSSNTPSVEPQSSASKPKDSDRIIADPPAPSASTARTHTVRPGETLSSIAKAVYGDARQYKTILAANPGLDPAKMRAGTVIQLPAASSIKAKESAKKNDAASGGVRAVSDSKTYVVQSGDSLYRITRKLYGTSENQEKLYELNKQTIGPDSTRLKPGMVLKLPAAPTAR
jgi:nucleoid-associated protein YgaU